MLSVVPLILSLALLVVIIQGNNEHEKLNLPSALTKKKNLPGKYLLGSQDLKQTTGSLRSFAIDHSQLNQNSSPDVEEQTDNESSIGKVWNYVINWWKTVLGFQPPGPDSAELEVANNGEGGHSSGPTEDSSSKEETPSTDTQESEQDLDEEIFQNENMRFFDVVFKLPAERRTLLKSILNEVYLKKDSIDSDEVIRVNDFANFIAESAKLEDNKLFVESLSQAIVKNTPKKAQEATWEEVTISLRSLLDNFNSMTITRLDN